MYLRTIIMIHAELRYSTFFASLLMSYLPDNMHVGPLAIVILNTPTSNDAIGVYSLFSRDVKNSEINNICSSYPNIMKIRYNFYLIT